MLNNILEILRWGCVFTGFFLANYHGGSAADQLEILFIWIVPSMAGLTGLESVFLARRAGEQSGYGYGGAYQRQSGLNNLATGLAALLVYFLGWGVHAQLAVMSVLLIFLALSAANHAWTALKEGNLKPKNLIRPLATAALLAALIPFMTAAIAQSS